MFHQISLYWHFRLLGTTAIEILKSVVKNNSCHFTASLYCHVNTTLRWFVSCDSLQCKAAGEQVPRDSSASRDGINAECLHDLWFNSKRMVVRQNELRCRRKILILWRSSASLYDGKFQVVKTLVVQRMTKARSMLPRSSFLRSSFKHSIQNQVPFHASISIVPSHYI